MPGHGFGKWLGDGFPRGQVAVTLEQGVKGLADDTCLASGGTDVATAWGEDGVGWEDSKVA